MKKIRQEDLTEKNFEEAREIINQVISWLTQPSDQKYILPILSKIKSLTNSSSDSLRDALSEDLGASLDAGLRDGLRDGLYEGLDADLLDGLDDSLSNGLYNGLRDGLYAGLYDGLDAGLREGLRDGLYDGLNAGLYAGLRADLLAGLDADLRDGLRDGLYAGLYDGLDAGLREGLRDGLINKAHEIKGKLVYCGVFWSWWLARYLIAAKWGCKLDMSKLCLLFGFVRFTPIVLEINNKIVAAKPTKIKWNIIGKTKPPFEFPIYELHSDGESTVECAGLKLYYHHNVKLPEYIGKVKIENWDPNWVLTEENQEVKRVLLENIPSEKVSEILNLKTLDTYKSAVSEYELVEAQNNPYPSHYRALRMKCPSTDKPYLIRVRPDMTSARQAVIEFNRGIDPETFIVEH